MGRLVEIDNIVSIKWNSPDNICDMEAVKKYADKVAFMDNSINPITSHILGAKMYLAIPDNFAPKYAINMGPFGKTPVFRGSQRALEA